MLIKLDFDSETRRLNRDSGRYNKYKLIAAFHEYIDKHQGKDGLFIYRHPLEFKNPLQCLEKIGPVGTIEYVKDSLNSLNVEFHTGIYDESCMDLVGVWSVYNGNVVLHYIALKNRQT